MALDTIIDGPRPGAADPELDQCWRQLRSRFFRAECGHPRFDPRHALLLNPARLALWREARRAWLVDLFADDPRVQP